MDCTAHGTFLTLRSMLGRASSLSFPTHCPSWQLCLLEVFKQPLVCSHEGEKRTCRGCRFQRSISCHKSEQQGPWPLWGKIRVHQGKPSKSLWVKPQDHINIYRYDFSNMRSALQKENIWLILFILNYSHQGLSRGYFIFLYLSRLLQWCWPHSGMITCMGRFSVRHEELSLCLRL